MPLTAEQQSEIATGQSCDGPTRYGLRPWRPFNSPGPRLYLSRRETDYGTKRIDGISAADPGAVPGASTISQELRGSDLLGAK